MGIDIVTFRIRIGTFSSSRQHSSKAARIESYKTSKKASQWFIFLQAKFVIKILLLILLVSVSKCEAKTNKLGCQNVYPSDRCSVLSETPRGVYSYNSSAAFFGYKPPNITRPNCKCINNFYARYTYGNRSNRGIKLSHWNAGNAHLENKMQ